MRNELRSVRGPHFCKRRECGRNNFLAAAEGDPGGVHFVTAFVVRSASWNVSDQIVAVPDHESMSKMRIALERETELDK